MDIEQPKCLIEYLRATNRIDPNESPSVEILHGGVSNRTVLVKRQVGGEWVIKQALAKLRVAADWYSSPERVHREAFGMRCLHELAPPGTITRLLFEDHNEHLLCMEAVPQPHTNWKTSLLSGDVRNEHIWQFGQLIGTIHRRSTERAKELRNLFDDRSFFESLRLEPYYEFTAQRVPAAATFLEQLLTETRTLRESIVHGDYSPKNVLIFQDRLILLDHEVIHWGDPAFDLGFSLTHMLSKAHHVTGHCDKFAQACIAYWQSYLSALDKVGWLDGFEERVVRHTLGCLLARVAGRSPLEYLTPQKRTWQQAVAVELMKSPPRTIEILVQMFLTSAASLR